MNGGRFAVLAVLLGTLLAPAARALAQAAEPFPEVPLPHTRSGSHALANLTLLSGAALIGSSFVFEHQADEAYDDYLAATDAATITELYDKSQRLDHYSTAALIGGEVLLATGLWMRFLRHPPPERLSLDWRPDRCALAWRF